VEFDIETAAAGWGTANVVGGSLSALVDGKFQGVAF